MKPQWGLEEILTILRAHPPDLRERYGVRALAVFGSFVSGEAKQKSDLDLLVEFETAPGFFQFIEREDEPSNLVGRNADLVTRSALKPLIGKQILAELVPV